MSDALTRIRAAVSGRRNRHSDLYRWLWDHYAMIADARAPGVRSDWITVARELSQPGMVTEKGKPLKPETVRRTWSRVAADAKASGWTGSARPTAVAPVQVRPAVVEQERQRQRARIQLRPPAPLDP